MSDKQIKRQRRHRKIRVNIQGTAKRPRLCVFRSQSHIYAQLIDDDNAKVLVSVSDIDINSGKKSVKSEKAKEVGKFLKENLEADYLPSSAKVTDGFQGNGYQIFFSDEPYNFKKISRMCFNKKIKPTILDPF